MALPSNQFFMSQVDLKFREQHPEAPSRLDPDDPRQAHLMQQWNDLFHGSLNGIVDRHFFQFFPSSTRLDPNNPEHSTLIEYWTDIRDAIGYGKPPRYNWDAPPATADTSSAPPSETEHRDTGAKPDLTVHMDENEFKEMVHLWLEGVHYLGDSAEVLKYIGLIAGASEESELIILGEALGNVGVVASTIIVLWATADAFGGARRTQEQEGFCYGLMWEVCGKPNGNKHFILTLLGDSAEDLYESFYEGVVKGRERGREAVVHNKVLLVVAYFQAQGYDLETAHSMVLNALWLQIRESDLDRDYLTWPTPENMQY
jgi:hypothetical protein